MKRYDGVEKGVDLMYRSLVISLTAIIVILAATSTTVAAQGGGFHGGGGGGSVFRGGPPARSAPGPAFFSRPAAPVVVGPVAPFATSPVAPFGRSSGAVFGFGGFHHPGGGRFGRTIVVPPVIYSSPYIWPTSIYGGYGGYGGPAYYPYPAPVYSEPAYASPSVSAPAVSQAEVDLAYQVGRLSAEVDQLRQQQTITSFTQPPGQTQAAPQQRTITPTVLVFRYGNRME